MPRVSVILPFYNRAATLPRCIESVRAQTFTDWEMVAVDDCSRDDSAAVVKRYNDARIRVLRHEQNRGAGPARDTAMANAAGEWFALIDSDDEWLPGKLAAQIEALERDGRAQSCVCHFHYLRDGQTVLKPKPLRDSFARTLHRECTYNFGTILVIHRDLARSLGPFDPDLPRHEDWEWMLRAAEQGHTPLLVGEPLARAYCTDRPRVDQFATSTERFLAKYDASFLREGADYRRQIVAYHYESVASMAYEQRRYRLGHRYLLKSFATWPRRSPLALVALPLSVVDWVLRTRFIQWGAQLRRRLFEYDDPPVVKAAA